jgi:subtilisin family serine protease
MAWTLNRSRRRESDRRNRPGLEHLDDRCLLSTGAGALLPRHAVPGHIAALHARTSLKTHAQIRNLAQSTPTTVKTVPQTTAVAPVERPAGTTVVTGTPTPFDPIIGAAATRSAYGVTGTGMTVAVIDTGVDYNNPALGGSFGPGAKVIAGYNFASNTADPMATTSQHGTAVAGLIGSNDPNHLGVAPGVNIVALKVTGDNNSASLNSIAAALQWVINNHSQYNITVVNMSLSDGGNYAQNWFAQDGGVGQQITSLIGQLQTMNIPVVSATGNSFNGQQGEGFTSIVSGVISVTATDTSGHLLPDAQRLGSTVGMGTMTDLAAPGTGFVAPSGDNGYSNVDGTSFATPLVSGAVVLLQQIYQQRFGSLPTVAQVTGWLEKGADPIVDPVTGLMLGQLDITKAAALIPSPVANPAPTPVSVPVMMPVSSGTTSTPAPVTQVSYMPVVSTPSTPTTTTNTPTTTPTTTPAPAPVTLPTTVQVFVNGQQVNSLDSSSGTSPISSLTPTAYNSFLLGMSAWAAGTTTSSEGSATTPNQVRIWNAPAPTAGTVAPAGSLHPVGSLVKMFRARHRVG